MDENQNYGNSGTGYEQQDFVQAPDSSQQGQGAYNAQQPYGNQQYTPGGYNVQQHPAGPQYTQTPYGAQQQFNQQNFGQPVKAVVYDAVPDKTHGTSVAALICGILGLLFFWVPVVDIGLCLAGMICSIISIAKGLGGKGIAITGMVLSIIATILTLLFLYFFALGMMLV